MDLKKTEFWVTIFAMVAKVVCAALEIDVGHSVETMAGLYVGGRSAHKVTDAIQSARRLQAMIPPKVD